jgi:hypothetical protein
VALPGQREQVGVVLGVIDLERQGGERRRRKVRPARRARLAAAQARRLRSGVEVADGPAGDELERVLVAGVLADVLRGLDDCFAVRVECAVFGLLDGGAGDEVAPVGLAVVGCGAEIAFCIEAFAVSLDAGRPGRLAQLRSHSVMASAPAPPAP